MKTELSAEVDEISDRVVIQQMFYTGHCFKIFKFSSDFHFNFGILVLERVEGLDERKLPETGVDMSSVDDLVFDGVALGFVEEKRVEVVVY